MNEVLRLYRTVAHVKLLLNLPLYNGDLKQDSLPKLAKSLAAKVKSADDTFIACSSYRKGPSGVLKNAFDFISRVLDRVWKDNL